MVGKMHERRDLVSQQIHLRVTVLWTVTQGSAMKSLFF